MQRRRKGLRAQPDVMQFCELSLLTQAAWNAIAAIERAAREPYSAASTVSAGREMTWLQGRDDTRPWASFAEACDWLHIAPDPFLRHLRPVFHVIKERQNGNHKTQLSADYISIATDDYAAAGAAEQHRATATAAPRAAARRAAASGGGRIAPAADTDAAAVRVTPARELACTCEHQRKHEHQHWRCPRHGTVALRDTDKAYAEWLKKIDTRKGK